MVSDAETGAGMTVHGHRLSTVVPGSVTGEVSYELADMDLAMKLHYLRGAYYFGPGDVTDRLTIKAIKEPMFPLLDMYFPVSGRVRRTEAGRPYIKCNDCGVRIIEAECDETLQEWLGAERPDRLKHLVCDKVLGPAPHFSPLLYIQVTNFRCGGMAIGCSWAHVLGDAVSATSWFNKWSQFLSGKKPSGADLAPQKASNKQPASVMPRSVKLIDTVGDCWLAPTSCNMVTYSFQITESKLKHLQSQESVHEQVGYFELISALMWQSLAKIRAGKELKTVTICKNDMSARSGKGLANEQKIGYAATDSSPAKTDIAELAMLIAKEQVDETEAVRGLVDTETGKGDVLVYGANLTFVDMQDLELYGSEIKGKKPVLVDYGIAGVGEEGAILVQQDADMNGRSVTAILPEDEIEELKAVLGKALQIA